MECSDFSSTNKKTEGDGGTLSFLFLIFSSDNKQSLMVTGSGDIDLKKALLFTYLFIYFRAVLIVSTGMYGEKHHCFSKALFFMSTLLIYNVFSKKKKNL